MGLPRLTLGAIEPRPPNKLIINFGLNHDEKCHIIWCIGWGHCVVSQGISIGFLKENPLYKNGWKSRNGCQVQFPIQYFSRGVGLVGGVIMLAGFANTLPGG
jgi:hypothetical protein